MAQCAPEAPQTLAYIASLFTTRYEVEHDISFIPQLKITGFLLWSQLAKYSTAYFPVKISSTSNIYSKPSIKTCLRQRTALVIQTLFAPTSYAVLSRPLVFIYVLPSHRAVSIDRFGQGHAGSTNHGDNNLLYCLVTFTKLYIVTSHT